MGPSGKDLPRLRGRVVGESGRGPRGVRSDPNPLLRIVRTYVRRRWTWFAAATGAALVKAFAPIVGAWVVARMVDELGRLDRLETTTAAAQQVLIEYALVGVAAFLLCIVPTYWRDALPGRAVREVSIDIRRDLYTHLHRLSQSFYDTHRSGVLASRVMSDVTAIEPFVSRGFVQVPMAIIVLVVVLTYFFVLHPVLALVSLILLPVQVVAMRVVATRTKRANREMLALRGTQSSNVQEKLAANAVVKAFAQESAEVERFVRESRPILAIGVRLSQLTGMGQVVSQSLVMLSPLSFVIAGGLLATQPGAGVTVGVLLQFIFMHARVLEPLRWMIDMQPVTAAAAAGAERVYEILDEEPAVRDRPGAVTTAPRRWDVRFEQVSFSYPSSSATVLDGLDLHIPEGARLALVGPSGGGKTTITSLLMRFYDVDDGRITVDGIDVRDYALSALRRGIGFVPQEPVLFSGSVHDNIRYGTPDASRADVVAAAERAYAHDFITALPHGYDETVGERGTALSGGQRQRIAIARVFLKDPAIVVLDEATSALDTRSEAMVGRALRMLTADRTTIIVAHRLSTVRDADRIVVVDGGRVVEEGTHDDLLGRPGPYSRLHTVHDTEEAA